MVSVEEYIEETDTPFEGTIIDIETIGLPDRQFNDSDSRKYAPIKIVIFGTMSQRKIIVYYVKTKVEIPFLNQFINATIDSLKKPFYAFSSKYERGVLFNNIGREIKFEHELTSKLYERKGDVRRELGIPNYDDPFNDNGRRCREEWEKGNWQDAIKHNRSCLLKERDIFLRRGSRKPDKLEYIEL